ncbi:phosphonate C-P lyase system protein PhnH [Streptomyces sp. NPDC004752]
MSAHPPHKHVTSSVGGDRATEIFRALLSAAAQPGRLTALPVTERAQYGPAVALAALAHPGTSIAIHPSTDARASALAEQIARHTGARPGSIENAELVAALNGLDGPAAARLRVGTASDPGLGAQVFVGCRSLRAIGASSTSVDGSLRATDSLSTSTDGSLRAVDPSSTSIDFDVCLNVSGPGVDGQRRIGVVGLDPAGVAHRNAACSSFPDGFDLWLLDQDGLICGLPRSTRIELVTEATV